MNCDKCIHYHWYYDYCDKWKCKVDAREVHNCCYTEVETALLDFMGKGETQDNHKEERGEADGCNGCKYIFVQTWEEPCRRCKRTAKDLYERRNE